jgi:hypothetical protein
MAFEGIGMGSRNDSAIRGVVNSSVGNVIQTIRVKQMYVDPGAQLGAAVKEVIFDFLNARLVSFDLDDLSHETSDANIMTMQFDYDWMEIVDVGSMQVIDGPIYNIAVPGVSGAPVDISVNGGAYSSPGSGNAFMDIISNQVGRAGQQLTSEAINRGVQTIAGKGRFASLVGSKASNILGGTIGAASRDLASGLGKTVNQAFARPGTVNIITPLANQNYDSRRYSTASMNVIDSAEGGPAAIAGITRSNDGEA